MVLTIPLTTSGVKGGIFYTTRRTIRLILRTALMEFHLISFFSTLRSSCSISNRLVLSSSCKSSFYYFNHSAFLVGYSCGLYCCFWETKGTITPTTTRHNPRRAKKIPKDDELSASLVLLARLSALVSKEGPTYLETFHMRSIDPPAPRNKQAQKRKTPARITLVEFFIHSAKPLPGGGSRVWGQARKKPACDRGFNQAKSLQGGPSSNS